MSSVYLEKSVWDSVNLTVGFQAIRARRRNSAQFFGHRVLIVCSRTIVDILALPPQKTLFNWISIKLFALRMSFYTAILNANVALNGRWIFLRAPVEHVQCRKKHSCSRGKIPVNDPFLHLRGPRLAISQPLFNTNA